MLFYRLDALHDREQHTDDILANFPNRLADRGKRRYQVLDQWYVIKTGNRNIASNRQAKVLSGAHGADCLSAVLRGKTPIVEGVGHLDLNIAAAMTFILLMSSFTMVTALARIREGNSRGMVIWLAATAIMGGLFLSSQAFEWNLLFSEGILPSNSIFGATFFILTGFHGTHVLLGIVWIIGTILRGTKGTGFDASNNLGVELTGLYWHFVDLVWVVIFMVVYLIN